MIADFMEYDDPSNKLGNYHYAKCFANDGYEVLWISCLWNKLLYSKDKKVYYKRKKLSTPDRKKNKLEDNIFGFAPYSKRLYGNHLFCKNPKIVFNNYKYIKPNIKSSLEILEFNKVDILWISNPKQYWLSEVVDYDKLIYRIPDDFVESGVFPKSIIKIENKLIDKADCVFVTDKKLMIKAEKRNKKSFFLPNGTEIEHFQEHYEVPIEYKNHSKKVVYVGTIGSWFDNDLIEFIAKNLNINIYIIGNAKKNLSSLKKYNNVFLLGSRPYKEVPAYLQYADVAIIPFIKNQFTDMINPIKLFEYFSTGIGVVSTDLNGVKDLSSPAYIAKNYDEFCNYIEQSIKNKEKNKERNIQFAKENTWKKRFRTINIIINNG